VGLLDGKVAVVTGAARGIGRAEALLLAAEGAAVVVNDVGGSSGGEGADTRPAQQVVDEVTAAGGRAVANYDNCATWSGGEGLVSQAIDTFGCLDILINNAGILRDRMCFTMEEAEWDAVIAVHLKGHFCPLRHAAAYWRQQSKASGQSVNAKVVNTTSESGLYGNAGQLNYAAAKAGIAAMTIVAARELERFGVRVNAIAPVARTRLTESLAGSGGLLQKRDEDKFDRFSPDNVAAVVGWLASDLSAGVSGQVIKVQGGIAQLLQGWRPQTQATGDKEWTIAEIDAAKDTLFAKSGPGVPPFFFEFQG
jgi:NAD(P)-dependent dehydrogenase (short-subunit alcohol dehydrogenase family)